MAGTTLVGDASTSPSISGSGAAGSVLAFQFTAALSGLVDTMML
jgi:hypothetical protein